MIDSKIRKPDKLCSSNVFKFLNLDEPPILTQDRRFFSYLLVSVPLCIALHFNPGITDDVFRMFKDPCCI